MQRRHLIAGSLSLLPARTFAQASAARPLRIGVLTDLSSPATDVTGRGSIEATRMAVEDWTGGGPKAEVLYADYQNKPDVGVSIARAWIDQDGVDVITDVANSAVALAVAGLMQEKNKTFLAVSPATTALTVENCNPNTVQWVHDSWAMASAAKAIVEEGGKTWFFITANYALGKDLESTALRFIEAAGGRVMGGVKHPLGEADFSSYLLQAQSSGAQVIGIASAFDGVNIMKQMAEFGMNDNPKQKIAMLITTIGEVHGAGLEATQGLLLTTPFYWDQDESARQFTARLQKRTNGRVVTQHHAGGYAATTHLLKAVAAIGTTADGRKVVDAMKAIPTDDPLYKKGTIRADGRKIHAMNVYKVKAPSEQLYPFDYMSYVRSIPAAEAFRPMALGGCYLVKPA